MMSVQWQDVRINASGNECVIIVLDGFDNMRERGGCVNHGEGPEGLPNNENRPN